MSKEAMAAEMARLRAENEALRRKQSIDSFLARRSMEDVMDSGKPPPGERQPHLETMSPASTEAWNRFRPATRRELSPVEQEILALRVEQLQMRSAPRRGRKSSVPK
jgi:hypothetical protein